MFYVPNVSDDKKRTSSDPAIEVMNDRAFYELTPSEQAARVRAARLGSLVETANNLQ